MVSEGLLRIGFSHSLCLSLGTMLVSIVIEENILILLAVLSRATVFRKQQPLALHGVCKKREREEGIKPTANKMTCVLHRLIMAEAICTKAASTFVPSLADVSRKGISIELANVSAMCWVTTRCLCKSHLFPTSNLELRRKGNWERKKN